MKAAPAARVGFAKEGPAPKIDPNSADVLDRKGRNAVAVAKARPRPAGRGGGTEADDAKIIMPLVAQDNKSFSEEKSGIQKDVAAEIAAGNKTPSGGAPDAATVIANRDAAAQRAIPRLQALIERGRPLAKDIIVPDPKTAKPGDFYRAYNEMQGAAQFDQVKSTTFHKATRDALRSYVPKPQGTQRTDSGPPPTAAEISAEAQNVADTEGVDLATASKSVKDGIWNRAKNNRINAKMGNTPQKQ